MRQVTSSASPGARHLLDVLVNQQTPSDAYADAMRSLGKEFALQVGSKLKQWNKHNVVAPVMLKGAQERLASEFPKQVASRFDYLTFAIDDVRDDDTVIPGIGGQVYDRLGMTDKNAYVPEIVRNVGPASRPLETTAGLTRGCNVQVWSKPRLLSRKR